MLSLAVWFGFILVLIGLAILLGGIFYNPSPEVTIDGTPAKKDWWEKFLDKIVSWIDKLIDPKTPTKTKLQITGILVMIIGLIFALGALYAGSKSDSDDKPDPKPTPSASASTTATP